MIGDEHADPAMAQSRDDRLDVVDRDRVHAGKRLVQQQELRLGHERTRDFEPAALATGELVGFLPAQVLDGELVEQRLEPPRALVAAQVQGLEDREHVFFDRQLAKDRRLLRQIPDPRPGPLVHRERGDVTAIEDDLAFIGANQAGDHVERRGLPRPVGPEQSHDLALREIERDVVHDAAPLVRLHEMPRLEATAAADNGMLRADRLAAGYRVLGKHQEILLRGRAVGRQARVDVGRERDGRLSPQRADGKHQHFEHGEAWQHGRGEIRPRVVDRKRACVLHLPLGVGPELEELLAIGDGQIAERGAALVVGDARERGNGEREGGVARRKQI